MQTTAQFRLETGQAESGRSARRFVRRWAPLIAVSFVSLWIAMVALALAGVGAGLLAQVSGGWLRAAADAARVALVIAQVVVVAAFLAGMLRATLLERPVALWQALRDLLSFGREVWWFLLLALPAWLAAWEIFSWRSATAATASPLPVAPEAGSLPAVVTATLVIVVAAPLVPVAPLIAVDRCGLRSAVCQALRDAVSTLGLRHLALAIPALVATWFALAAPVLVPRGLPVDWDYWPDFHGSSIALLAHRDWTATTLVVVAVWASCVAAAALTAALYRQVTARRDHDAALLPAAPAVTASRPLRRGASAVAALVLVAGFAAGTAWASGRESVQRTPQPGQPATLACGISAVAPPGRTAVLSRYYQYPHWLPLQENTLSIPVFTNGIDDPRHLVCGRLDELECEQPCAGVEVVFITSVASRHAVALRLSESHALIAASADGSVAVHYWAPGLLEIVVRRPGRAVGVVTVFLTRPRPASDNLVLARLWRALHLTGAPLPTLPIDGPKGS